MPEVSENLISTILNSKEWGIILVLIGVLYFVIKGHRSEYKEYLNHYSDVIKNNTEAFAKQQESLDRHTEVAERILDFLRDFKK